MIPDDLHYTAEHEWIRVVEPGKTVRIGITDHAQSALGDIVFVDLPAVGASVTPGGPLGEVESTKSVSEVFGPVAGTVAVSNESLETTPELINSDPYGAGWLVEITLADDASLDALLDPAAYQKLTGED